MSVQLMSNVFNLNPKFIDSTTKSVLLALADHANDEGKSVYPSVLRICWKTSLAERTVRSKLKKLRESEYIVVDEPSRANKPTLYSINIDKIWADMCAGAVDAPFKIRGAGDAGVQVQEVQGSPAGDAPKAIAKPSDQSEVSNSSKSNSEATPPKPPSPKVTWLTVYDDIHKTELGGGIKNMGQAARDFKKLEAEYDRDQVIDGWRAHCKAEKKFASTTNFASKPLVWMKPKAQQETRTVPQNYQW